MPSEDEPQWRQPASPALRVRLADRSLRRTTPILGVTARLLELASSRVTASEVLDLADTAPVRARFGFDDDELAQIRDWVANAQIHWGLDAAGARRLQAHRGRRRHLGGRTQAAAARCRDGPGRRHSLFGGVLPVAAVQSSEIELAGRSPSSSTGSTSALRSLTGPQTVAGVGGGAGGRCRRD